VIKTTKIIFFWTAIVFIILSAFSLTIGQIVPYEFANSKLSQNYYDIIMLGFPIAILFTLFDTIKKENTKTKNWINLSITILTSIASLALLVSLFFNIGFGSWISFSTIYKHKKENLTIKEQRYDNGALGYGRHRIVELKPILKFWVLPTEVDTTKINKNEWKFVNEEGDIKFP
jgi:hypothetical protein